MPLNVFILFQFHGHCLPECKNKSIISKGVNINGKNCYGTPVIDLQAKTAKEKELLLSKFSDKVVEHSIMWECQWDIFKKENKELMEGIWKNLKLDPKRPLWRLPARAAVRGGFLELYRLSYEANENFDIHYYDANSMYSSISVNTLFPVGEYKIILEKDLLNTMEITDSNIFYCGEPCDADIALVSVLAPSHLSKPFLPYRLNNQTFYSNCFSCLKKKNVQSCKHQSINKRRFVSVWTVAELHYSIKLGYRILHWYELMHYEKREKVLSDFVTAMASLRLKNSDLLANVPLNEQQQFCEDLNVKMNFNDPLLSLNPSNVKHNKVQQEFYKLLINSVYGRFALNSNHSKRVFLRSQFELDTLLASPNIEVLEFFPVGESTMECEYLKNAAANPSKEGCLIYTALINAKSRILMHQLIMTLEKQNCITIYVDTDCLLYAAPKDYAVPFDIGPALGQFKPVLGESAKIKNFYSLGPRNYTILYEKDGSLNYLTKIKGLNVGCENLQKFITPETYKNFLASHFKNEIIQTYIPQQRQRVEPQTKSFKHVLLSQKFDNQLHLKRFIVKNDKENLYMTYPYGYGVAK